jgi:dienelactone hydrolase
MTAIDFQERLLACLGGPWPDPGDLRAGVESSLQKDGYRLEAVRYDAEPGDRIPAWLLIPDGVSAQSPAPAVCVWHQHAGNWQKGKSEPAGLGFDPMHHTGVALCREGYVVLCPDALCFEDRQDPSGRQKNGSYERFEFLRYVVNGKCMAWKNILDMKRAVDFLVSRPEVRPDSIGCYGHSMGSTFTWLIGPWEPRLKCLVGNCCLPTYAGIHREHMLHCFPNFIPGLHQFGDTFDIASLIAPRPLHMNFGDQDSGSPIDEVRRGIEIISRRYESVHAEKNFSWYIQENTGHVFSPEMWERTKSWFARHLF